jgi:ribosomal protein S18 acetylase RimI-like enzyme
MDERAVTASDRAFLLEVYADSRRAELACLGWSAEQTAHFVEMQFCIQQRGYQLQFPTAEHRILLCDGEPAGQWRIQCGEQAIVLVDIAMLERFRGRGIGSACITQLCREAESGDCEVFLSVRPENRAYGLYRRLGFEESSRDETRVCLVWRSRTARGSRAMSRSVDVGPPSTSCPKFVPVSPRPRCAGEGHVEPGPMGHSALSPSSTLGETRRGLRVSPTSA